MLKNIKYYLATIILLTLNVNLFAQYNVTKAENAISTRGVFYSLPQTYFIIDVEVEETKYFKGPYADYADKLLGLEDVILNDKSVFNILELNISTTTQPDPLQSYFVDIPIKTSNKDTRSLLLGMDEAGILTIADQSVKENKNTNIQINKSYTYQTEGENFNKDLFNYVLRPGLYEKVDTIIKLITIDTSFIEDISYVKTMVEMTLEQKAEDAKNRINKIKTDRYNLLTGYQEVAYDKGAIQYMHEQLKLQEDEFLAMFTGKKLSRKHTYRFYYTPQATEANANVPIFKFSKSNGLSEIGIGEQVFIKLKSNETTKNVISHTLRLETSNPNKHGFYYRIPEYADVSFVYKGKTISNNKFMVCQFGTISYVPFGEKVEFELNPNTGTIKKFYLE